MPMKRFIFAPLVAARTLALRVVLRFRLKNARSALADVDSRIEEALSTLLEQSDNYRSRVSLLERQLKGLQQ